MIVRAVPPGLTVEAFVESTTGSITYLLADEASREAAVIDPVLDCQPEISEVGTDAADLVLQAVQDRGLQLRHILETHLHADHVTAAAYLRSRTGAPITIGAGIAERFVGVGSAFDRLVRHGDMLSLGDRAIEVIATPGHTACAVCYRTDGMAFVGDTLLMPDIGTGRADFPGADAASLYRSIRSILRLPAATRLFVGHDYPPPGRARVRWETTVAEQSADNILVRRGVSEAEFVEARNRRDLALPPPRLLAVALPANLRGGLPVAGSPYPP